MTQTTPLKPVDRDTQTSPGKFVEVERAQDALQQALRATAQTDLVEIARKYNFNTILGIGTIILGLYLIEN